MTAFDPTTESRMREIQAQAEARRQKREQASAELAERTKNEEQRVSISPRDVERQAAHKAACDFWEQFYKQEQERDYHKKRKADIATMADLKLEWETSDTTPARRGHIVRQYGELYRRYEPKTTDEMILAYWQGEKRKAMLQKTYGAAQ
jgi:hypothetical protein